MIDLSRLFPPRNKIKNIILKIKFFFHFFLEPKKTSIFHHLFRPEFVKKFKTPLCSDSCSKFNSSTLKDQHVKEVREAQKELYENIEKAKFSLEVEMNSKVN